MSKKTDAEDYSSALQNYEQSLIVALEKINENQKKLIESTTEFYAWYFSMTSEIMRKNFDYYSNLMSNLPMFSPTFFDYRAFTWPGQKTD